MCVMQVWSDQLRALHLDRRERKFLTTLYCTPFSVYYFPDLSCSLNPNLHHPPHPTQPNRSTDLQVRAVCRQQFMARALGNKIAAKQNEERRRRVAQPAPAGAYGPAPVAGPQGGVPMPIGDSWYSTGILPNPLAPMAAQR